MFTGLDGEAVDELSSQFSFYAQIGREGAHEGEDKCEVSGMGGLQVRGGNDNREVGRDTTTLGEDASL